MLTYLYQVTEGLLLCAALTGLLLGDAWRRWDGVGRRIVGIGCAVGWSMAVVIAALRNTTKLIDAGFWNLCFAGAYLAGLVLFLALFVPALARILGTVGQRLQQLGVALMLLGVAGYTAPEPLSSPYAIVTSVKTVISTDFFFRMLGWLAALVLMFLLALAVFKALTSMEGALPGALAVAGALVGGLELAGLALRALLTRRIIPQSKFAFNIAVLASNYAVAVACVVAAITLGAAIALCVSSFRAREPYSNPAAHRKIRAKWRRRRRWAACLAVCVALSLGNVTLVKALDSKEVELSPSEEFELRDDGCYVPLSQVDDGHLHRFTYESADGVGIRFIIIKKPGGSAYGIGLDACDICGETGYYERDDQVVCKLCDVVMNIQTIGFKGGCNPIVIDYEIRDGYIVIPFDTLLEHEEIFTR